MATKRILIVDDEQAILTVLKSSLKKLENEHEVVTATNAQMALTYLHEQPFDLVVTDYRMGGMSGLDLLETIRKIQPDTRVILMTAYGSPTIENEAQRLKVYRYLRKPLEISSFRQIVKEALRTAEIARPGILVLSDENYLRINQTLQQLKTDIGARCVFLTDAEGRFIARVGNVDNLPLEQIATLVGGAVATLLEAGRVIDGDAETVNLAYREGQHDNLYVINIGRELLLIIIIQRSSYSSRLGSVWYYAQQTALHLREKIKGTSYAQVEQEFGEDIARAVDQELDNLFGEAPAKTGTAPTDSLTSSLKPSGAQSEPRSESLLSYEDAIYKGIINEKIINKADEKTRGGL